MQTISRRMFLVLGGCALVTPSISLSMEVPALLDHILLGCSDLGRGVEFVEEAECAPNLVYRNHTLQAQAIEIQ